MTATVLKLNGETIATAKEPSQHLIESLTTWLEAAQAGEISGGIFIANYADGATGSSISDLVAPRAVLGEMQVLAHRIINGID